MLLSRLISTGTLLASATVFTPIAVAATIPINESLITQAMNLPANTVPGVVVVCEFLQNFGNGCVTPKDISDNLLFRQAKNPQGMVVSVFVNLCSDDNGDFFGGDLADSCPVANVGDRSAISEGLFGGFSYTPSTSTDPGFEPGLATQNTYLFAGDVSDVPEPGSLGFGGIGVAVMLVALRWRKPANS